MFYHIMAQFPVQCGQHNHLLEQEIILSLDELISSTTLLTLTISLEIRQIVKSYLTEAFKMHIINCTQNVNRFKICPIFVFLHRKYLLLIPDNPDAVNFLMIITLQLKQKEVNYLTNQTWCFSEPLDANHHILCFHTLFL